MRDSTENKITMAFIRHGETASNRRKSYLGWTDEPLSEDGCEMLLRNRKNYPAADLIFTSPMLRCRQTKEILYKDQPYQIIEKWKEMNFGSFEGKTYFDLNGNEDYQRWTVAAHCRFRTERAGQNLSQGVKRDCWIA